MTATLEKELDAVVRAGLFATRDDVVTEAISVLFSVRPAMRLEAAIELFKEGEVSLSRAAEMAGLSWVAFRRLLTDRGIPITLQCDTPEAMDADISGFFGE